MEVPLESVYSGIVSLRGIHMVTLLDFHLQIWCMDMGNAYLESYTREKVSIMAGKEFRPDLVGHTLLILKALYGLRSSGLR
jgi:hypothetical protein